MFATQISHKLNLSAVIFLVWGLFFSLSGADKARAAEDSQFFSETGQTVSGKFLQYWRNNGGLPVYGYPITGAQMEIDPETGKTFLTQWFERNRFEYHPENAGTKYEVLLGLLGKDLRREALVADQEFVPAIPLTDPATKADTQIYFKETDHNLQGLFYKYWRENGGLERFGYPISEMYDAIDPETGDSYPTQWFERTRFEYHSHNQPPYNVLLGLLGKQLKNPPAIPERVWAAGASSQSVYLPNAIGLDSNKNIFVVDRRNRVLKYNSNLQLINIFAQFNTTFSDYNKILTDSSNNIYFKNATGYLVKYSPGLQLLKDFTDTEVGIHDFAVDADGSIYSTPAGEIVKHDSDGKLVFKLAANDKNKGWTGQAYAIALDSRKNFYVLAHVENTRSYLIVKVDNQGKYLSSFKFESDLFLENALMTLDNQGNIYILSKGEDHLLKFTKDGIPEKLTLGYKIKSFAIDEQGNSYTISDDGSLRKYNPQGAITKWGIVSANSNLMQINTEEWPKRYAGMVTDKDENIYVTDYFNSAIKKFNSKGQFLTSWGKPGPGKQPGELSFAEIAALAIDGQGFIYVADDNRVQKFTSTGQFLDVWGPVGAKAENNLKAKTLTIDPQGYVYLGNENKISKYDMAAKLLASWPINTETELSKNYLERLTVDKQGNVYALLSYFLGDGPSQGVRVRKYDSTGQILFTINAYMDSYGTSYIFVPTGISLDDQNNIYISYDKYPDVYDTGITKCTFDGKSCAEVKQLKPYLRYPSGIATINPNLIYVFDLHLGLQKLRLP